MDAREAERLIAAAVPAGRGAWADFGAGDGTFTRALSARLGPGSRIYSVDRDARALKSLERASDGLEAEVTTVVADLEQAFALPGVADGALDGLLLANTLHFLRDAPGVLRRLATWLCPGGLAVVIEYDQRTRSRWVPFPIETSQVAALFASAGFAAPRVVARAPSAFGGELYVAVGAKG